MNEPHNESKLSMSEIYCEWKWIYFICSGFVQGNKIQLQKTAAKFSASFQIYKFKNVNEILVE